MGQFENLGIWEFENGLARKETNPRLPKRSPNKSGQAGQALFLEGMLAQENHANHLII